MESFIYLDITLHPKVFSSIPLSDTIFGEFCWCYRFIYGEEKLKEILQQETPLLAFSDLLPVGAVPVPKLPLTVEITDKNTYSLAKKFKKVRFVKEEILKSATEAAKVEDEDNELPFKLINKLFDKFKELSNTTSSSDSKESSKEKAFPNLTKETRQRLRVKVARNGIIKEGALFNQTEESLEEKVRLIAAVHKSVVEEVEQTLKIMGDLGIGAKKSVGYGSFEILEIKTWKNRLTKNPSNWFISCSFGLPKREEVCESFADFKVKYPKHGQEVTIDGVENPFKKPVILAQSGSTFKAQKQKPIYGSLLSNKSPVKGHKHSGLVVPLFI